MIGPVAFRGILAYCPFPHPAAIRGNVLRRTMDRSKLLKRTLATLLLLGLSASPALALHKAPIVGHASVIAGDTIKIDGKRIRLHGIDAPDERQLCTDATGKSHPCDRRAASTLAEKIKSQTVICRPTSDGHSHPTVAECWLDNLNLNIWIVAQGWAIADREGSTDYAPWEDDARGAQRGIWAEILTDPSQ